MNWRIIIISIWNLVTVPGGKDIHGVDCIFGWNKTKYSWSLFYKYDTYLVVPGTIPWRTGTGNGYCWWQLLRSCGHPCTVEAAGSATRLLIIMFLNLTSLQLKAILVVVDHSMARANHRKGSLVPANHRKGSLDPTNHRFRPLWSATLRTLARGFTLFYYSHLM